MTDAIPVVVLPSEQRFVEFRQAPGLTSLALYPEAEGESELHMAKRQLCYEQHEQALKAAVEASKVTPLNPTSYVAEPWRTHDLLRRAMMSRADFVWFAESVFLTVDEVERPTASSNSGTALPTAMGALTDKSSLTQVVGQPLEQEPKRQDALAVEINEICDAFEANGDRITATAVFASLKKQLGNGGCVVDVKGDALVWERTTGKPEEIDVSGIAKRISRWRQRKRG